jgi:hypothetical protein
MFSELVNKYRNKIKALSFTIHGFVTTPSCLLYESKVKSEIDALEGIKARASFDLDGEKRYIGIIEGASENGARYDYDESLITKATAIGGDTISLTSESPYSFIETIVAMNKHYLQKRFEDVAGKWIFTRLELDQVQDARSELSLVFRHNMNFRLTKSDVLINDKKVGEIYFSLLKA